MQLEPTFYSADLQKVFAVMNDVVKATNGQAEVQKQLIEHANKVAAQVAAMNALILAVLLVVAVTCLIAVANSMVLWFRKSYKIVPASSPSAENPQSQPADDEKWKPGNR